MELLRHDMVLVRWILLLYFSLTHGTSLADMTASGEEYDFVVVGGGSAGATVANRLSESSGWSVVLLEAGGEPSYESDVPYLVSVQRFQDLDWGYVTEAEGSNCLGQEHRRLPWPRGKVLGGTSVLNSMLYSRGNRHDFDLWESLGNQGWSYQDVLPFFLKSEDNHNQQYLKSGYHAAGGYLSVEEAPYRSKIAEAFLTAAPEMGYEVRDCNGQNQTGFMIIQGTVGEGKRYSTDRAFLEPVRGRPNLHIYTRMQVQRVLIDTAKKAAYGVEVKNLTSGEVQQIRAKKEVILCAGAMNSPQILMLSGVGPAKHLASVGVSSVLALPGVGQNLRDHLSVVATFLVDEPISLKPERVLDVNNFLEWLSKGDGPLSVPAAEEGMAFLNTAGAPSSGDWPNIEFQLVSMSPSYEAMQHHIFALDKETWEVFREDLNKADSWMVVSTLMRPNNTGAILLKSKDPLEAPIIIPNCLSDPEDLELVLEGFLLGLQLAETSSYKAMGSKFWTPPTPACKQYAPLSKEFWRCYVLHTAFASFHSTGTCRMGPSEDKMAVVDSSLKVHGISGLRVIDASVMPTQPTGNINAVVIMIGDKGAEMVKNEWKNKSIK